MTTLTIVRTTALVGSILLGATAFAGDYASTPGHSKATMMDTNKDGTISAAEHAAGAKSMFSKIDANGDGKVTAIEMDGYHAKAIEKSATAKNAGGMTHGMSSADKIKSIDTDGDGALSAEEHAAGSRSMFSKMDTDQDGNLTTAELQAGHDRMMSESPPTVQKAQ